MAGNAHLDGMQRLRQLASLETGENRSLLATAIDDEYRNALAQRHGRIELLHIGRRQFEYEHVSRDFDYSPQYIERLMEQGAECATQAIDGYRSRPAREPANQNERTVGATERAYLRLVQPME